MSSSTVDIDFSKVILNKNDVDMVIYHGNCTDGFASAFSAWYYLSKKYPEREVIYYPAKIGEAPPDVSGKNVIICDYSYKYDVLMSMLSKAKNLLILDHHKTSQADLLHFPEQNKIFRMDHSGAYLTWAYFFNEVHVPKLILYVEDNDIWTKRLEKTREFTSYMFTLPMVFEEYEKLLSDDEFYKALIIGEGMQKQD